MEILVNNLLNSKLLKKQSKEREEVLSARQIMMDHLVEVTTPNLTYIGPTQISNVSPPKPETRKTFESNRKLIPNMAMLLPKLNIPDMAAITGKF